MHFNHQYISIPADTASQNNPIFNIDPNTADIRLVRVPTAEEIYLLVQVTWCYTLVFSVFYISAYVFLPVYIAYAAV